MLNDENLPISSRPGTMVSSAPKEDVGESDDLAPDFTSPAKAHPALTNLKIFLLAENIDHYRHAPPPYPRTPPEIPQKSRLPRSLPRCCFSNSISDSATCQEVRNDLLRMDPNAK